MSASVISDEVLSLTYAMIGYYYSRIVSNVSDTHLWFLVSFGSHGELMYLHLDC